MLSFSQVLFHAINSYAGHSHVQDLVGIVLAEGLPYLFILNYALKSTSDVSRLGA